MPALAPAGSPRAGACGLAEVTGVRCGRGKSQALLRVHEPSRKPHAARAFAAPLTHVARRATRDVPLTPSGTRPGAFFAHRL